MTQNLDLQHLSLHVPPWLVQALEVERSEACIDVAGCPIHYFTWGDPTNPPLLFVHGVADLSPGHVPVVGIPYAHHHIMADQPVALAT